ncbi:MULTISPECIES: 30S ribosomal protein S17 [Veillonella]|uniref:Small ribosomal subunit protein uS17 n=2 Tax=Veillonella rogosae TaxID=423477 RepID=A0AA47AF46_9FIRM|nr:MULTISPECIES: 30S ribosomal protein S17 [Veillonella]EFR60824.1 30S ribosomal protein S17 [Veillonella sp. oral taxon 158 str. F0412]MBF1757834.1 30S ribosomal protein S17 [Veillonella sp.]MBS6449936.1 30S ribosomal protein S17 [Veillonella sp. oral taxon 158]MDU2711886.1 30S ribosomal protein S17 [Veillonella sp.]MDU2869518.1 30S ribosomal protein S17 [Veillonella sp.]
MAEERNVRKVRVGKVVSDKMNKTVVVAVERKVPHALYNKPMVSTKRFKAHDENNECQVGDTVKIVETRPLSKDKCWRVVEILERLK